MNIVHESSVDGNKIDAPFKRTIRHIIAPWTVGSKNIWLGVVTIEPGYTSNPHFHEKQEEIFYCVSGKGRIRVDDEEQDFYPGMVCHVPAGCVHQLINLEGSEPLKFVATVSPAFEPEQFKKDHAIK